VDLLLKDLTELLVEDIVAELQPLLLVKELFAVEVLLNDDIAKLLLQI
jgi:hypothetical protein